MTNIPSVEQALVYQVTQNSGVQSIIGSRFYPVALPQGVVMPSALYQIISGINVQSHGEASFLPRPRIQITCWSDKYEDVVAADKAIKSAIDGKRGTWGTGSYLTPVESCLAETVGHDDRDPDTGLFQRSRDYLIMWRE